MVHTAFWFDLDSIFFKIGLLFIALGFYRYFRGSLGSIIAWSTIFLVYVGVGAILQIGGRSFDWFWDYTYYLNIDFGLIEGVYFLIETLLFYSFIPLFIFDIYLFIKGRTREEGKLKYIEIVFAILGIVIICYFYKSGLLFLKIFY